MKYHYTYRITNTLLNKHYYGVRTSKNRIPEEDLGIYYFSSSTDKNFIKDQKENPKNYKYKIIKKFATREEAAKLEIFLHEKFNVKISNKFYNLSNASSIGFSMEGENNPMFNKKHNIKTKLLMSKNHKGMLGKTFSSKTKKILSEKLQGKNSSSALKINIFSENNLL